MKKVLRNSKTILLLVIIVGVVALGGIGVTMATLKDASNKAVNQFTVGNVTTEIVEIFNKKDNYNYEKNPRVTNTGMNDCYIRMRYEVTPEKMEKQITFNNLPGADWKQDGDWYYYTKPVAPGESTSELFTGLTVDYNETDKPWMDFDIILYQEAVQAKVFDAAGTEITDADEIWAQYNAQK